MLRTEYGECVLQRGFRVCEHIPEADCFIASPLTVTADELEEIKAMED